MELKSYETVFIMNPVMSESEIKDKVKKFAKVLKDAKAEIIYQSTAKARRMAYPIQKKQTGIYQILEFKGAPTIVEDLEKEYRIDNQIMRFLTIALDKHGVAYNLKKKNSESPESFVLKEPVIDKSTESASNTGKANFNKEARSERKSDIEKKVVSTENSDEDTEDKATKTTKQDTKADTSKTELDTAVSSQEDKIENSESLTPNTEEDPSKAIPSEKETLSQEHKNEVEEGKEKLKDTKQKEIKVEQVSKNEESQKDTEKKKIEVDEAKKDKVDEAKKDKVDEAKKDKVDEAKKDFLEEEQDEVKKIHTKKEEKEEGSEE